VIVGLVVGILVVGYFAFVGTAEKKPPLGPTADPTGEERQPIAYGYLTMGLNIHNNIGGGYKCTLQYFEPLVYEWTGEEPAQLYEQVKYDPLGLFGHDDIRVHYEVTIVGPNQWSTGGKNVWMPVKDPKIEVGEGDHKVIDFESGILKFWDTGEYTCTIVVSLYGQDTSGLVMTEIETFSVTGF
jgi:hypothetical protein